MTEERKALLFAATILAARRHADWDGVAAVAAAARIAEPILAHIDQRYPITMRDKMVYA